MTDWGVSEFTVGLTKDEIKAGITRAYVEVSEKGITRVTESSFEVAGVVADEPEECRQRIATRPIGAVAVAEPVDSIAEHGLVIRFKTRNGQIKDASIPRATLEDSKLLWAHLAGLGLQVMVNTKGSNALKQYLIESEPDQVIRSYGKPGWHDTEIGAVFAMKGNVIGDPDGLIGATNSTSANTSSRGTFDAWLEKCAQPALAFPPAAFGLCCAFAPALIPFVPFSDDGGFHFYGASSSGKTIFIDVCASAWGAPKNSPTHAPYVGKWNITTNGLEDTAEGHNNLPVCLDELADASASVVSSAAYMLSDGQGKKRLDRTGKARRVRTFRTLVCSSGEISIAEKIKNADRHLFSGQALRICDIDIKSLGLFVQDKERAALLKLELTKNYGHAGPRFVEKLQENLQNENYSSKLSSKFTELCDALIGDDSDPRRNRAARRFALVQLAGELAKEFGLVPRKLNPKESVGLIYESWKSDAGETETNDDLSAAKRLAQFIDQCSGVSLVRVRDGRELHDARGKRHGWIDEQQGKAWLLRDAISEALGNYSLRAFTRALVDQKIVDPESTRQKTRKTPSFAVAGEFEPPKAASMPRTYHVDLMTLRAYAEQMERNDFLPFGIPTPEPKQQDLPACH